jgi:threonine synthase
MNTVAGFKCVDCGREHRVDEIEYVCISCGGNLDVVYDYDLICSMLSKTSLAADRTPTIWRYRALLPINSSSVTPPLTVGGTPIYACPTIARRFGLKQLWIKDDGRNPTGSFKDRPSAVAIVKAQEVGASIITTASSGNAGSALAGICASIGMESIIFVPASAPKAKIAQLQIYGATVVLIEGSYDQAYDLCQDASKEFGWYQRNTGYNPFTREGKKTAALEIAEQLNWEVPDKVIVSVGDGNIISGLWKGFNDLRRIGFIGELPQMIGAQSQNASAIVDAAAKDGVVHDQPAHTIADGINVGKPRDATMAVRAIRESGGCGIKVTDEEIIQAIPRLARETGVFVEPAAAASYAALVRGIEGDAIKVGERVLLMLTGNGLKDFDTAKQATGEPIHVVPDIDLSELESRIYDARTQLKI